MWQAIIAKQEDNLYYLLKFFAESLDDDILKEKTISFKETADANSLLMAMNRAKREVAEKEIPKELKEIKDAITEENKKLLIELNSVQKPKKPPASYGKGLSAKQKEIQEIKSQIRSLQIKQRKAKGKEAKQIKEQIEDLREKSKKGEEEYKKMASSITRKITEDSKKIADQINNNKNTLKEINEKIKESEKVASQKEFDDALLAYIKQPTKANLQKYLGIIQDAAAIARYAISFDKGTTFSVRNKKISQKKIDQEDAGYRAVEYSEELKEAFDAQLRGLGLGTLEPEEVLNRIKSRKEVETINKPLNQIELVSTLFNDKDMKELKRLIADNKNILDTNLKVELPYPKGSEPSEYFDAVLNTKVDANSRKKRLSPIRLIHDAHRGAVYRIYELLQKIYARSNFSEPKKKTAKKLMTRLETLTEERKEFKVDLKTGTLGFKDKFGKETDEAKRARGQEQFDLSSKDADYWNKFVGSTVEFYSQMQEDIDLTKQQADAVKFRKDTKRRDADESVQDEIEKKMKQFADKVSRDEDFRESVSLILENFYSESSAKSFISETLFDSDKGAIYIPQIHRDKITDENKEKLLDAGMELFAELNQTVNFSEDFGKVVYYNDRINDILEGTGGKTFSRTTLQEREINNLLRENKDRENASKYVRNYVYNNLKKLIEEERQKPEEEGSISGEGKILSQLEQFEKYLDVYDENVKLAKKLQSLQQKLPQERRDVGEELDLGRFFDKKKLNEFLAQVYPDESQEEEARETKKLINELSLSFKNRPSTKFMSIVDSISGANKEEKKFLRIFNNRRTQENLRTLGLGGA